MQVSNSEQSGQTLSGRLIRAVKGVKKGISGKVAENHEAVSELEKGHEKWRDPVILQQRITVPWHFASPELQERIETISEFEGLAKSDSWSELLSTLKELDQTRQRRNSGVRFYEAALLGARSTVTRNLEDTIKLDQAREALEKLKSMQTERPNDYAAAVIVARALIDLGWAERGSTEGAATSAGLAAFRGRFAEAETILEKFDPIEENSPMLAEARYLLAPGIDGGVKFLRDWYEDWADLDPSNPTLLETHSRYLMPQWYGSFEEINKESRRAGVRAKNELAAGAYTYFWLTPLSRDEALAKLNPNLFIEGMHDILMRTKDQRLANAFAAKLYRLGYRSRGRTRHASKKTVKIRARLAKGFGEIVRHHLREIHTLNWSTDDAGIRLAIAQAFGDELNKGAHIRPGSDGLEAIYNNNEQDSL